MVQRSWLAGAALALSASALAAPDEQVLGRDQGYPVGRAAFGPGSWFFDEAVRVGSFTHQAEIAGLYGGRPNRLLPADAPMPLPHAARTPDYRWQIGTETGLTVDQYLARQRIMGLLIVKDGVVQLERYQYDRGPADRFTSQSMAKSITSLAVGLALAQGSIRSLDDPAQRYAPALSGSLLGDTRIRDLLRMASGARYEQRYDGSGDSARFSGALSRDGIERAAHIITEREGPDGQRFHYTGAQTAVLAAVVRGATGMSLTGFLTPHLWQAIGAEHGATWLADRTGLEVASGNFNATLRDYARLGVVLANDGVRPDDPDARPIIPREYLLDATDGKRQPPAFRPGRATPYFGYGYQFWIFPGESRRFALLGVYGQAIFVDPGLRLVMVQTAANRTAEAGQTSLGRERDAFWRGLVSHYGAW